MGRGGCISTSACIGHALPRQEFTSSMQLVPSSVLGLDSKPCKAPGETVVGVRGGVAALAHRALLSPPDWLSQHHPPVPPGGLGWQSPPGMGLVSPGTVGG